MQEHVYRNWIRDTDQLKLRLVEELEQFQQSVINEAVKQWHQYLKACIRARTWRTFLTKTLGRPIVRYFFRDSLTVNCHRHCL